MASKKVTVSRDRGFEAQLFERGSFGSVPTIGLTGHHWSPETSITPVMSLPPAGQHIWATLFFGDGRVAFPMRQFQNELAVRFFMFEGEENGPLDYHEAAETGYAGICLREDYEGRWGLRQPGKRMRFAFLTGEHSARWRESEVLDLELEPVLNALQFAIPDATEPFAYFARAWRVKSGEILGCPVTKGIVCQEQVYVRPGDGWFTCRYYHEYQKFWITFATEYEDGNTVFGQFKVGKDGLAFAIVQQSDGAPVLTTDLSCEIELDGEGYLEFALVLLPGGEEWVWSTWQGGGGHMPLPDPGGPRWREGVVTRKGETRKVRASNGWSEVYPSRLCT